MESWSTCTSNCINESYANQDQGLPPGFRFHPTDEELITHYLANKVDNPHFTCRAVSEADLNKSEPWELPEKAQMGEKEWYFFSARDRKYPTGMRTNRATEAGYWKATGKDREVMSGSGSASRMVGMKKTLVFYRGRAPKGIKTNWVMHEYRNEGHSLQSAARAHAASSHCKDEWVVCRIFHKTPGGKKMGLSEIRQGSHMTSDNKAALYATSLPALLDSPIPTNSSGGHSDQEKFMFNTLLHYKNSGVKSEVASYVDGSCLFNSRSMTSLVARNNATSSIISSYPTTTSTPSLLSSIESGPHNAYASVGAVPSQQANYPLSTMDVSSPMPMMANTFNNNRSPQNVATLTTSDNHNHQHHLSSMQLVNSSPYNDALLNINTTSLTPPLSHLPSDFDTFWV